MSFLERVCRCLDANNVSYAIVGGYAVALHGAPRGTIDGDLIVPRTPGPDRWTGGRLYTFADNHVKFLQASRLRPSADDCPDFHLTPNGLSGSDLR